MAKTSYENLIRRALQGNKYLDSGELNPNYNPKWGLAKGRYINIARSYAKNKELFIETSKTENPIEFIATGIISGKAQYQFRELEERIKGIEAETDARTRAVDVSRLESLINSSLNMEAIQLKDETIYTPAYYAEKYLNGEISRQQFFDYIEKFKTNSQAYLQGAYGNQ